MRLICRLSRTKFCCCFFLLLLKLSYKLSCELAELDFYFGSVGFPKVHWPKTPWPVRTHYFDVIWGRSLLQFIIYIKIKIKISHRSCGTEKNRNFKFLEFCRSNLNQIQSYLMDFWFLGSRFNAVGNGPKFFFNLVLNFARLVVARKIFKIAQNCQNIFGSG